MNHYSTSDIILMVLGVGYGILLLLSAFVNNRAIEAFRIDLFLTRKPNPVTKKLNILFGFVIIGISIYSFLKSYK